MTETQTEISHQHEWIKQMRLKFCVRSEFPVTKNIIFEDGSLNQEYFQPPKGTVLVDKVRTWTPKCRELLIKGIGEFGIGQFRKISNTYLSEWVDAINQTAQELRLKTIRLIGRQNLQLYKNWKGSEQDIQSEYQINKEIGLDLNAWKGNVLVYDDDGLVLERIKSYKRLKN